MAIARYSGALLAIAIIPATAGLGAEDYVQDDDSGDWLTWERLPDLPNELGVAGPFVGVHRDALIVAGGANFPRPVWETTKQWVDAIHVLVRIDGEYVWKPGGTLSRPMAYGAAVSLPQGVLCMGGNDSEQTFDTVFLLKWNAETQSVERIDLPPLPSPCAYGQATVVGKVVYLAGGQSGGDLAMAMNNFWALDLSKEDEPDSLEWTELPAWPGKPRAFNLTVAQHNGYNECVYVISGRRQQAEEIEFLKDTWEYNPQLNRWRKRRDAPRCVMAGTAVVAGQSHVLVLGGADGSHFHKADQLRDDHPGFPPAALAYHTITDSWTSVGAIPQNQVTTIPATWNDQFIIASGEVRPRVRTPAVWAVKPTQRGGTFGAVNYTVLIVYLAAMVGVGVYCNRHNVDTDDYFRGGKNLPWWAAGCSIFATMLSSLTFTGIPAKAFAQDWVYAIGNFMIPVVAIVAVFVALPFYRQLDVTSAYEYLERRFSRSVRLFGSLSFSLFHLFRMAVVMSLTGLALAVATPLTPVQCVLLMGILSIAYCTIGGIEAVVWTDTIQTFVLFGGALLALLLLLADSDGGFAGAFSLAQANDKLRLASWHWDATSAQLALWVVIIGAIGQNLSSYTADQAVVQRYMTTPTRQLAARSIWVNAILTMPATLLFFGIGTALFAYYHSHPQRLDPTLASDQVFPYFIATEMPIGIAGLVVAGIFAAAQSTVSTSMNSVATTLVTDFVRPFQWLRSESSYLHVARLVTSLAGVIGTVLAVLFVDPSIKSLFDAFLQVIGLFMGVLGGLFVLGFASKRANAFGAMCGALVGAATMFVIWRLTSITGYIYTTIGISTCVIVGWAASFLAPTPDPSTKRLTRYALFGVSHPDRDTDIQPVATASTSLR